MNPELRELYQDVILDHGKRPRNFHRIEGATHHADGFNPLCGDKIHLELMVAGDAIKDAAFTGSGCAISTASASMMTEALKGRSLTETESLFESFHCQITGEENEAAEQAARLGKLAVFAGVREYPTRVKCAVLAWHTLRSALEHKEEVVTTE